MTTWAISTATEIIAGGTVEPFCTGQIVRFGVELLFSPSPSPQVLRSLTAPIAAYQVSDNLYDISGRAIYIGPRDFVSGDIIMLDIGIIATVYPSEGAYLRDMVSIGRIISGRCSLFIDQAYYGPSTGSQYVQYAWRIDRIVRSVAPYVLEANSTNYVVDRSSMVYSNVDCTDVAAPDNVSTVGMISHVGPGMAVHYRPSHAIEHILVCTMLSDDQSV
jgi:hypothetical protein